MTDVAIRAENLGKRYRVGGSKAAYGSLRESLVEAVQTPFRKMRNPGAVARPRTLWALRDAEFEVNWGEVLGIVGRNGAGKSTLLKILSRVTYPTIGRAQVNGRVGALLEVGTGFHAELTGRENIHLNGAILGMRKAEIRGKFDEIVEFAETGAFLDMPVKRYSSGMYMRLAFSIAAHLEPEILVVDEVLAVGDAAFQKKCLGKMSSVARDGRTILFVSHNMPAVQALCHRALLLEGGRIVDEGTSASVVQRYLDSEFRSSTTSLEQREDRLGDGSVRIVSLHFESSDPDGIIRPGSRLLVHVGYRSERPVKHPQFIITVCDHLDVGLFMLHSEFTNRLPETLPPEGVVTCQTDPINVTPGPCVVNAEVLKSNVRADFIHHAGSFDVENDDVFGTGMVPPREWVRYILDQQWWLEADGASGPAGPP
jgi:lipopolysaccharide transport system ATP-binding protein